MLKSNQISIGNIFGEGQTLNEKYMTAELEFAHDFLSHVHDNNELNARNHVLLDKYISTYKNKCFKAQNCTFKDVIVLNYDYKYTLVYSITYNCLYVMELACVDNSGYIGFFGSIDGEWEACFLNKENIKNYITKYFTRLEFSNEVRKLNKNEDLKSSYRNRIFESVKNNTLKDSEVYFDDLCTV